MTKKDLIAVLNSIPDNWNLSPWIERQAVVDGSQILVFIALFPRQYTYRKYTREDYEKNVLADQVVLYAQHPRIAYSIDRDESGSWGRTLK